MNAVVTILVLAVMPIMAPVVAVFGALVRLYFWGVNGVAKMWR